MIQRERVTEDIYVFTSEVYVQVTAGVVDTADGAVVIDTLLYPDETLQIKQFIESRLKKPVRYVVNTHHHADHTTGTCYFEGAQIIAHQLCYPLLDTRGRESLINAKDNSPEMSDVELILPQVVFDDKLTLHVGDKTLHFEHMPGHSADSIVCWVEEDDVLFAADLVMPIPVFIDGNFDDFLVSLSRLASRSYENIIQGHGEIVLRGEVAQKIKSDIAYLNNLRDAVDAALNTSDESIQVEKALASIAVDACGKSHILLNGAVEQLHYQNVLALAQARAI